MAENSGNGPFAPWDDPSAKPLISFQNVTKRFGDFVAIDDLTLDIFPGEFFALLGPSGCGKTTLMRMLAGFEKPSEGRIFLNGEDLTGTPANKRQANMMFQSYALFPHMSVWENIAFGLKRDNLPKDQVSARVDEMLRLVQLEKFGQRKPDQISGGQRQRVALARSLAKAPKVLLLDEPLGALDKKLRQATQFELVDIQERTGTTFLIVTHDQEEAMTVSTRIAVMDDGLIRQIATPGDLYERPNSRYVADFIGDVNLIEGRATKCGRSVSFSWQDGQQPFVIETEQDIKDSDAAWLSIRPEKVQISKDKTTRANNIQGTVIDIAYLGNLSTYVVEIPGGQKIRAQATNAQRLSRRDITWNDTVWLGWTETAGVLLVE